MSPFDVAGNSDFYIQAEAASVKDEFEKNIFTASLIRRFTNPSLTGTVIVVSAEAEKGSFEIGAGGIAVDYNSPSAAGTEVATFILQDGAGNQETVSITFDVSEAFAITLNTDAEALQGALINRDNLSGGGEIRQETGLYYGTQIGTQEDSDFSANYRLLNGSPLDTSNQVDVLAEYDGSSTYVVSEDELVALYATTADSPLSVIMDPSSKYDFTYDSSSRQFVFRNIFVNEGGFTLRYRVSDELGNVSVSQKLRVFQAEGPVEPEPLTIDAGVEGEDFFYHRYQAKDNNKLARRGFEKDELTGDYWIKSKNGSDDLIGNGQEIFLVAGSRDLVNKNTSAEDILAGLENGSLIAAKSFKSYDGIDVMARFEESEIGELFAESELTGKRVRVTRVEAETFEAIGSTTRLLPDKQYNRFDRQFDKSLSAQNSFDFASELADNPNLGII